MDQLLFASSKARAPLQAIGVDGLRTRGSERGRTFPKENTDNCRKSWGLGVGVSEATLKRKEKYSNSLTEI